MILYSIEYALSCSLINDVVVSTDDKKIAKLSMDSGAKIINRPYEFATDTASTESVMLEFVKNYSFDKVIECIFIPFFLASTLSKISNGDLGLGI